MTALAAALLQERSDGLDGALLLIVPKRQCGDLGRCDGGPRARGDGCGGGEPAGDQPDAERQLEQSTGDGADEPGARDAEQLQQCARGDARVADETPDSQETRNESGAEEQSAE